MQGFTDREPFLAAERAAKASDFIRIYDLKLRTPALPLPFCGPDRAAFYFISPEPEDAREDIAAAKQAFADTFGVTFGWKDVWSPNGPNREYGAELRSGLSVVLITRTEHMRGVDEAVTEDAGELVAAA
jgi:hypothetical protein